MITSSKTIITACAADDNYAMPLAVTIRSLLEHLNPEKVLRLIILDGGICSSNKRKLLASFDQARCHVEWSKISPDWIPKLPDYFSRSGHLSASAFHRLLIPRILKNETKCLYLDCDTIACCDVGHLWDLNIEKHHLLAVQDAGIPFVSSKGGLPNYKRFGLTSETEYFNSGVILINLEKWRKENIPEKVFDYTCHNQVFFGDQDGLNAVLAGKWGKLDPSWNFQTQAFNKHSQTISSHFGDPVNPNIDKPRIIHFTETPKPWLSKKSTPYSKKWFEYVDQTMWRGYRFSLKVRIFNKLSRITRKVFPSA